MSGTEKFIKVLNKKLSELTGAAVSLQTTAQPFCYICKITSRNDLGVFFAIIEELEISGHLQPPTRDDSDILKAVFNYEYQARYCGGRSDNLMTAEMDTATGEMKFWDSTQKPI